MKKQSCIFLLLRKSGILIENYDYLNFNLAARLCPVMCLLNPQPTPLWLPDKLSFILLCLTSRCVYCII